MLQTSIEREIQVMKNRIGALLVTLIGICLTVFPLMYMIGNPWGALPCILGCFFVVLGIGKFVNPLTKIVFRSEYDS
jgi:hypothetical protein